MIVVWRIHRAAYGVGLDGAGGRAGSGRWNVKGAPLVYTAGAASLAILERLVNSDPDLLPSDLRLTQIEIPDDVPVEDWSRRAKLPTRWRAPANMALTRRIGMQWLASNDSAVLRVPSAIVPEESNFLLNPAHSAHPLIRARRSRPFRFDARLFM
jgi:RES domain-containing protein